MKNTWKTWGTQAGATSLSVLLLTSCLVPTASAAVRPVLDEAYYGTLDGEKLSHQRQYRHFRHRGL